ncbi:MAG: helix-turn-helix transcriptional regulator [Selenomonadaceae bacterium]|nr:helix-turn-helix transcriptional regulator [Selenomonadaceae bacterium]
MNPPKYNCPVDAALSVIGGKYKLIILYHLKDKTLRFSELRRLLPQATHKMLTQQLRELESDGIIHREIYPIVPPKTEYSLTEFGKTLTPVVTALCDWGKIYINKISK